MQNLLYVVFPAADYTRCLKGDPPLLMNNDEDEIGASVFKGLLGEKNLILTQCNPLECLDHPRADVLVGFEFDKVMPECKRIAFSGFRNAYLTAMDQGHPLTEEQLAFFKRCLEDRRFENDIAFVTRPMDIRTAAFIGVRNPELLAEIQKATDIKHVVFRSAA